MPSPQKALRPPRAVHLRAEKKSKNTNTRKNPRKYKNKAEKVA